MQIKNARTITTTLTLTLLTVTSGLILGAVVLHPASAPTNGTPTFLNYELAGNEFTSGNSVGTTCPNSQMTCQSTQGEPAIRSDPLGNFYGSSESTFCVIGGLCGGTFAWKSTDAGNHFTTLPLPNSESTGQIGVSTAGGDTDIAVASQPNSNGFYNVYVASLASKPPLANIYVSTSKDGGASWFLNPTGASIPVDDREWEAADGANKVCISYHAYPTTGSIVVNCSLDGGLTFAQVADAFDTTHQFNAAFENQIGNLAIDPGNHLIYQVWSSIANTAEVSCLSCSNHVVWVAVSIDGGKTFTDYPVYINPNTTVNYGHQFVNVSVDRAGNVYVVYNDNHNMFYSFSQTFGQSWSGPFQINKPPSSTAIFPWSSAGRAGELDVVWYGSSYFDGVNPPDTYPLTASWNVFFAQNLNALTPGSTWTQVQASGIIHYGGVCESGVTCTGNRDLLDDFGVATSPTTGLAAIIYTNDQYLNTALEPATTRSSGSQVCSASTSNSVDCSHTDIAVQTGGTGVNQTHHKFEVHAQDFEELDLSGSGHSPSFSLQGTDTADAPITAVNVQINGLSLSNLSLNGVFPVQPGQSITASTTTVPVGLALNVGTIYTVTITTNFADGTGETQSTSAIYSLGAGLGL